MNPEELLYKYTEGNLELQKILIQHSKDVAEMTLRIIDNHHTNGNDTDVLSTVDRQFVWEAAMLHDIGIVRTNAPGIHCHGEEPYLKHGIIGAEILREEGLPKHARVAERHTGTGLTAKNIREQNLPLPEIDLCPESIEEKLICYADKFFSKTSLGIQKPIDKIHRSILSFGKDGLTIFEHWYQLFGV